MPIIKNECSNDFTLIPNELAQLAQTGAISYAAAGVLVDMCSRPSDWVIHKDFYRNKNCGRDAMNKIFMELQVAGYLKIEILRESGKITDNVWYVSNKPIYEPPSRSTEKPASGKTGVRQNRRPEKQHLHNKEDLNNKEDLKNKEKHICEGRVGDNYPEEFETTWAYYPKRLGTNSKVAAFKCWKARISEGISAETLLIATKNYQILITNAGTLNTPYVMQGTRFYGVNKEYEQFINLKPEELNNGSFRYSNQNNKKSTKQRISELIDKGFRDSSGAFSDDPVFE